MSQIIKRINNNHIIVSLFTSLLAVVLTWGIFGAQYFWSDGVTLARNGDAARYTLPVFIEMGEQLASGEKDGIDVLTVNGSNSMHLGGLEWYIFFRIFAYLGKLTSPLLMFMAFLALHMFLNMYFTQRLCHVFFKMSFSLSFFIAVSVFTYSVCAEWFMSFFVIVSIVIPLVYGVICMLKSKSKLCCVLSSFLYVAALTSGYIVLSCALAAIVFCFSLTYALAYKINEKRVVLCRSFGSAFLGLGITFPWLLNILRETMEAGIKGETALSLSTALSTQPTISLSKMFFYSNASAIGEEFLVFGMLWSFMVIVLICTKITSKMELHEKIIFGIGILGTIFVLLADLANVLPFDKWIYMVPIFGGMHLRRRYFMIFGPLLFISLGIALKKLSSKVEKKKIITIVLIYVVAMVLFYYLGIENMNKEAFVIEMLYLL